MAGLFGELKRRNVFKVGAAYVVAAWLIAQGVDVFLENFGAPAWAIKTILLLLIAGLPVALIFAWAFEITPEGIKKEKDVDRSQSVTHETGRRLDFIIIAILLVALGWFTWDKFTPEKEAESEPDSQSLAQDAAVENTSDPVAEAAGKSIAVLPFVNMSDDAGNEYFSDGISEEILNALAKVKELKVAGRTSSFAFKGENQDLRKIGQALGVKHILEGSVRKSGAKVRITAQLIQVDDGFHLWSDSYDRELTDVFAIQDEIANAILEQLKLHLLADAPPLVETRRANTEAYDLYLMAKQRAYERLQLPLESAAELLDQAIAIDPEYAPAYAQRGIVTLLLSESNYGTTPDTQANSQAKLFVDQALRLDPQLAEAWAAKGLYHDNRPGEDALAIEALEKALSINPNLIDAANWLNNSYIDTSQPAKAVQILEDITRRDPLFRPALGNLTFLYVQMGDLQKAAALVEKARPFMEQDPNIRWLDAMLLLAEGETAKALPLGEEAVRLQPQDRVFRTALGLTLLETAQFERGTAEGFWNTQAEAMLALGRVEEATMLAREKADAGEVDSYFRILNVSGQSDELVTYLEQHWPSLDAFAAVFPPNGYFGWAVMNDIALAYRRTGNQTKFNDALLRVRQAHDSLAQQGLGGTGFLTNEAVWYALADDREQALIYLGRTIDDGRVYGTRIAKTYPAFSNLEGDPEFEAIQVRMIEHLNRERAALGLEPVSI